PAARHGASRRRLAAHDARDDRGRAAAGCAVARVRCRARGARAGVPAPALSRSGRHRRRADTDRAHRGGRGGGHHAARGSALTMSFILDALRKSEHERRRGALPGVAHIPYALPRARLPVWVPLAIAALALALLL